jgi:hypothetical protein
VGTLVARHNELNDGIYAELEMTYGRAESG